MNAEAPEEAWQARLHEVVYDFGMAVRSLHKTNPWPEHAVLDAVMTMLATEFWDHCFSQAEIRRAYEAALSALPHYTAGEDIRP